MLAEPIDECIRVSTGVTGQYAVHVASTFLPVTPRKKRNLGRAQGRSLVVNLPLTKLGQALAQHRGRAVHAAGTLCVDRWNGTERVQLRLIDIAAADAL